MNSLNDYGQPTEIALSVGITDLLPRLFRDKPGWILHSVNLSSSFLTLWLQSVVGMLQL